MSYNADHRDSDNKDPGINAQFNLGICASVSSLFARIILDWLQSPVTKLFFFLIILINNPLK